MQALRQRQEPALRDRLRPPRHALAAQEELLQQRVRLQLLQQVVHGELRVAVVEPDHHPDREHVVAHRVDERAAELAVLLRRAQRPAQRVDHAVERLRDLPDLLHAERPHLRVLALEPEPVERDAGQVALRPLGEHGHARVDIGAGLEVAELLTVLAPAAVAGAHAADAAVADEQGMARGLGQDRRAALLRPLGEPAAELRQRGDVVAAVLHRRRRRDPQRALRRQEVDRLVLDPPVERQLVRAIAAVEQAPQRARVDHRAREQVRPRLLALLQHGDGNVAEPLRELRRAFEQLPEPDRAREPRRPGADDQDADLDLRLAGRGDELVRVERRWVVGRPQAARRARTSSVSFGRISFRSPTTPRSAYSKIGAFGSLLIATIRLELCIPTLCWIAPEMPTAT